MSSQAPDEVFTVTYSKWKLAILAIFIVLFLCILTSIFLVLSLTLIPTGKSENLFSSGFIEVAALFALPFIFIILMSIRLLKRANQPYASLTPDGFYGGRQSERLFQPWTSQTVAYFDGRRIILTNPDPSRSQFSQAMMGDTNAISLHGPLSHEKRQDVQKALDSLCPYLIEIINLPKTDIRQKTWVDE